MRKWMPLLMVLLVGIGCEKKQSAETSSIDKDRKTAPVKKQNTVQVVLEAAISARGGLEKLKANSSWSAKARGEYLGMRYTAINYFRPGELRMDVLNPEGKPSMSMLFGLDSCWSTIGPVLIPCDEDSKRNYRSMMAMDQATQLWPLLEKESDWKITADKEKIDIKEYHALKIQSEKFDIEGVLYFDLQNHHLVRTRYTTNMMGKQGELINQYWEIKEACGLQLPHKIFTTFADYPYMNEEIIEINCQAPDEKLFAQPSQVADGTFKDKTTEPMVAGCLLHNGPYRTLGESMKKLTELMTQRSLLPMGPPVVTYLKGAPKIKNPKKFVTEICFPLAKKPSEKPDKADQLTIKEFKPTHVLSLYGLGDASSKMIKLFKTLFLEMKKRKLRPAGPISHIYYMDPATIAVDQRVFEIRQPIKPPKSKKHK